MKMHIDEFVKQFAAETRPDAYHLSPESVARFRRDDRVWPVSVWVKAPGAGGTGLLQQWQVYPDPCDPLPDADADTLVRTWKIRRMIGCDNGTGNIQECPEEIISSCDLSGVPERVMGSIWQIEHGRTLPNMPDPGPMPEQDDGEFTL